MYKDHLEIIKMTEEDKLSKDVPLILDCIEAEDNIRHLQHFETSTNNLFRNDEGLFTKFEKKVVEEAFAKRYDELNQ